MSRCSDIFINLFFSRKVMNMKNLFALLCVLAVIGTANAVYLTDNGDFEATAPGEGWGVWAGGAVAIASENLSGGVGDSQYVSLNCGTDGWAGWYNQNGVGGELNVLGIPAGETVTVACDIKSLSGVLNSAGLKAESWAGGVGGASVGESTIGWPLTITTSWAPVFPRPISNRLPLRYYTDQRLIGFCDRRFSSQPLRECLPLPYSAQQSFGNRKKTLLEPRFPCKPP
jgi:hypothetical protein